MDPELIGVTAPKVGLMEALVAFVEVHVSVEIPPGEIEAGEALNVQVGSGGIEADTVAEHTAVLPREFVAVPVYVVTAVGETVRVPPATGVTAPIAWSIAILTALLELHVRTDEAGATIVVGLAESVHTGTGTTVTVAEQSAVTPMELVAVPVYEVVTPGFVENEPPAVGVFVPMP